MKEDNADVKRLTSFVRFIYARERERERENLVFDSLIYLEPVESFKNRS